MILRGELKERFDAIYYSAATNLPIVKNTIHPVKKLSTLCEMQRGRFSFRPRNDPRFYGGQYPFIQTGDIVRASQTNEKIIFSQSLNDLGLTVSKLFDYKTILITIAANIGDTAILDYPACFPDSLVSITPKTDDLNIDYLNTYFKYIKTYLENLAPQAAQKNINLQQLSPTPIVVPPLSIQQEIVDKFEAAYTSKQEKKAEAKQLLASIDDYLLNALGIQLSKVVDKKKTFFMCSDKVSGGRFDPLYYTTVKDLIQQFKFELKKVKHLVNDLKSGFGAGKQDQAENEEDGIIQIRPTNIDSMGQLKFDRNVFIPKELAQPSITLSKDDVLFNNTNSQELVGKTAYFDLDKGIFSFSNHITRIRVNEEMILPQYLQIIFNFYQKHKIFYAICTNWNNQSGVGNELLLNLEIPLPPLSIQEEIAAHISAIRNKAQALEAEAKTIIESAKQEVERMILGE